MNRAAKTLPYERLLRDALRGDPSLFTRDDSVEAAWRVIDPVLSRMPGRCTSTSPVAGDRRPPQTS